MKLPWLIPELDPYRKPRELVWGTRPITALCFCYRSVGSLGSLLSSTLTFLSTGGERRTSCGTATTTNRTLNNRQYQSANHPWQWSRCDGAVLLSATKTCSKAVLLPHRMKSVTMGWQCGIPEGLALIWQSGVERNGWLISVLTTYERGDHE